MLTEIAIGTADRKSTHLLIPFKAVMYAKTPLNASSDVRDLSPDGSVTPGDWREANIGLPLYDPPDDTTLFAQHVIAADDAANPEAFYIGGEGINFFKATSGLDAGSPVWQESKSGLSNLIMARTPIVFSGQSELDWYSESSGSGTKYTIYLQDKNGNPPIAGVNIEVFRTIDGVESSIFAYTYPDSLVNSGTWRDPSDPATNDPYVFFLGAGEDISFQRTPVCSNSVPGCSWGN
jgi:hypothetical protein